MAKRTYWLYVIMMFCAVPQEMIVFVTRVSPFPDMTAICTGECIGVWAIASPHFYVYALSRLTLVVTSWRVWRRARFPRDSIYPVWHI